MDKITYLRVYFELKLNKTAVLLNTEKFRPKVIEYPISSVIHGNKPIETPRYRLYHDSIKSSIRPILEYEEVTNLENIIIEVRGSNKKVILPEETKKRILNTIGIWMDKNWQELPTHI